jgi:RNA polymerase sigma factor (TIGR02999 family)
VPAPELDEALYDHLRRVAFRVHHSAGNRGDTLGPTALLHEAWVKLSKGNAKYADRSHFIAVAARAMRHILVDRARASRSDKHGNGARRTTLSRIGEVDLSVDLLDLHAAIESLAAIDALAADVVVLRAFGGLTVAEVAEVVGKSGRHVDLKWRVARAYLAKELSD